MKKVLIVSFYELKEFFSNIKDSFEYYLYEVYNYPLYRYAYDRNDKKDNYMEHMNEYINSISPDAIFWWFIDVPRDVFMYIKKKNPDIYYIMFNNDEDMNMSEELLKKASIFDLILTPCKENIIKYRVHSKVNNIEYIPHCHDPEFFYPITIDKQEPDYKQYECDISIICYNLYLDKNYYNCQYVNLKKLMDDIAEYCNNNNRIFAIYGPSYIKEYYPANYKEDIHYIKMNSLFNYSKINLVTNAFSTNSMFINDKIIKIFGSGGLLLTDKIKDIDKIIKNNEHCIFIEKENYIDQIHSILNYYDKYTNIRKNAYEFSKNYTWKNMINIIHTQISKKYFDEDGYKKVYKIETNDAWSHWSKKGIHNKELCYKINIPDNFNYDDYSKKYGFENESKEYLYLHWYTNKKEDIFIKSKQITQDLNVEKFFITVEDNFEIYSILNKTKNKEKLDEVLEELFNYANMRPYININKVIETYFSLTE